MRRSPLCALQSQRENLKLTATCPTTKQSRARKVVSAASPCRFSFSERRLMIPPQITSGCSARRNIVFRACSATLYHPAPRESLVPHTASTRFSKREVLLGKRRGSWVENLSFCSGMSLWSAIQVSRTSNRFSFWPRPKETSFGTLSLMISGSLRAAMLRITKAPRECSGVTLGIFPAKTSQRSLMVSSFRLFCLRRTHTSSSRDVRSPNVAPACKSIRFLTMQAVRACCVICWSKCKSGVQRE